jgi:hypothetical protein
MAYRLGWALYWTCIVLIGLYVLFWVVTLQGAIWEGILGDLSEWTVWLAVVAPALALYGLGRAFRYVLAGD